MLRPFAHPVARCCTKFETGQTFSPVQTDATLLASNSQNCWESLRPFARIKLSKSDSGALPFSLSFLKYIIFRLNNSCHVVAQNGGDLCSQSYTLLPALCFCVSYLVVIYFKWLQMFLASLIIWMHQKRLMETEKMYQRTLLRKIEKVGCELVFR